MTSIITQLGIFDVVGREALERRVFLVFLENDFPVHVLSVSFTTRAPELLQTLEKGELILRLTVRQSPSASSTAATTPKQTKTTWEPFQGHKMSL